MDIYMPKTIWHCSEKKVNDPIFSVDALNEGKLGIFATGGADTNVRV